MSEQGPQIRVNASGDVRNVSLTERSDSFLLGARELVAARPAPAGEPSAFALPGQRGVRTATRNVDDAESKGRRSHVDSLSSPRSPTEAASAKKSSNS